MIAEYKKIATNHAHSSSPEWMKNGHFSRFRGDLLPSFRGAGNHGIGRNVMRKTVLIAFLATFAFALAGAKVQAGTSLLKETVIEKLVLQVVSDVQAGDY
jgi:hypothetical protein